MAMMPEKNSGGFFTPLIENTWVCVLGYTQVGVYYLSHNKIVLIDSGSGEGEKLLSVLGDCGLSVRAVLATHLHFDHIAANEMLYESFGTEIIAAEEELPDAAFCGRHFTYPISTLPAGKDIVVDGHVFRTVPTPGHSRGHQLIFTPDGVCFCGDVIMTPDRLRKSKLPYMRDVEQAIKSMYLLKEQRACLFAPSHLGIIRPEELDAAVEENVERELGLYEDLRKLAGEPISPEALEEEVMHAVGVYNPKIMAFHFMHVAARARINELLRTGEFRVEGNLIVGTNKAVESPGAI